MEKSLPAAAFYDLDGTLVSANLVTVFAYFARNDQGILRSVGRTAATVLGVPVFLATDFYSRNVFNVVFYKWYKGQSEDRLRYLSEDMFEDVIKPSIYPGTLDLLEKSRSMGLRQVVVTGALDITIQPLLRYLGIEDYAANRLEFSDGKATGRLVPPVMASATKASWIRTYAEKEGLSLSDCYSYADSMSDLPMLSIVGHPTATNPDLRLRSTALRHDWPVVYLKKKKGH
jgi:HAD superfamily hydrolase (TIGR01490 family)